jgi:hypothetical protein
VHLSPLWIAPLVAGGVGAAALVAAAAVVRREVSDLQRSMRPLRVKDRLRSASPGDRRTP